MNKFWITTTDTTRRSLWLRLFGRDTLPVKHAKPRWIHKQGVGCADPFLTLAYDLDLSRLHEGDICRLAGWVAKRQGVAYKQALMTIRSGWTIPAANCEIVEPVEQEPSSALSFLRIVKRGFTRGIVLGY